MAGEFVNYYEVLGVPQNATPEQIVEAYRRKSGQFHPDHSTNPRAKELQQRLNRAFEVLRDPERRAEFDQILRARSHGTQLGTVVSPPPPPVQRTHAFDWGWLLRTAALVVGCLGAGGILATAAVTAFKRPPTAEEKAQQLSERELELQHEEATRALELRAAKLKQNAELAEAKVRQDSALATVSLKAIMGEGDKVLALLRTLDSEVEAWETQVRPLLSNDRGKLLSPDEEDVRAFQASWNADRSTKSDVNAIEERVKTLLRIVSDELAKPQPLVVPDASLTERLRTEAMSIEKLIADAKAPRQQIERLLAVAERSPRSSTVPLQQAIEAVNAKDQESKNKLLAEVEKENQRKLAAAEAERKKQEGESTVNAVTAQAQAAKLAAERALARELALKKAESPETKALLAFFLTPGYVQPGPTMTAEKRPISYGKLAAQGFLEPSLEGLSRLYQLVNEKDPDRPYLKERHTIYRNQTDAKKQYIVRMQKALIELGPALVELKLLDP